MLDVRYTDTVHRHPRYHLQSAIGSSPFLGRPGQVSAYRMPLRRPNGPPGPGMKIMKHWDYGIINGWYFIGNGWVAGGCWDDY